MKEIKCSQQSNVSVPGTSIDSNDQYIRRDNLIMSGINLPTASLSENSKLIIQDQLRLHTNLNVNVNDISIAHRIGRKPVSGPDKRNIIFKLCRRDIVPDIFRACKEHKPPFFVNSSLTPLRSKIFFALRQLKRVFPNIIKSCQSNLNGDIIAYTLVPGQLNSTSTSTRQNYRKHVINAKTELEKFAQDFLHSTIENLSVDW